MQARETTMIRNIAEDAAILTAAFLFRNVAVLIGLSIFALIALAR
jgi:hypothetical protein